MTGLPTGYAVDGDDVEAVRAQRRLMLDAINEDRRQRPFAVNFGDTLAADDDFSPIGPAGPQTLQMRDTVANPDQGNWGKHAAVCGIAIGRGEGSTIKPMKTTANVWVLTTADQASEVLEAMLNRGVAHLANYGRLKALIAAATTVAELLAINLESGW